MMRSFLLLVRSSCGVTGKRPDTQDEVTTVTDAVFEEMLAGRAAETVELARAARALIRELDPDVVEVPWPRQGIVGFGIGPKKLSQHYAYLALYGDQVNLGFNQGAELDDPAGLLGGTGKSFRHRRIDSVDALRQPEFIDLLRQARRHREATTDASA
jgi:hypothetical protein